MALDVIVERDPGNKDGEDIVDPLISTVSVALVRGRNELDRTASPKVPVQYTTVYRKGLQLGNLVEILDSLYGRTIFGKITAINHAISPEGAITELTIEELSNFQS